MARGVRSCMCVFLHHSGHCRERDLGRSSGMCFPLPLGSLTTPLPRGALTVETTLGRFLLRARAVARRSRATRRSASRRGSARSRTPRPRFARARARARRGEIVDRAVVVGGGSRPRRRLGRHLTSPPAKKWKEKRTDGDPRARRLLSRVFRAEATSNQNRPRRCPLRR